MASDPRPKHDWFAPRDSTELTLEEAIANISSGTHFNFGNNVEARRRYYRRKADSLQMVKAAGYAVLPRPMGFGCIVKTH